MRRRHFLQAGSAALGAALAGCNGVLVEDATDVTPTPTEAPTDTPTQTPTEEPTETEEPTPEPIEVEYPDYVEFVPYYNTIENDEVDLGREFTYIDWEWYINARNEGVSRTHITFGSTNGEAWDLKVSRGTVRQAPQYPILRTPINRIMATLGRIRTARAAYPDFGDEIWDQLGLSAEPERWSVNRKVDSVLIYGRPTALVLVGIDPIGLERAGSEEQFIAESGGFRGYDQNVPGEGLVLAFSDDVAIIALEGSEIEEFNTTMATVRGEVPYIGADRSVARAYQAFDHSRFPVAHCEPRGGEPEIISDDSYRNRGLEDLPDMETRLWGFDMDEDGRNAAAQFVGADMAGDVASQSGLQAAFEESDGDYEYAVGDQFASVTAEWGPTP